MNNLQKLLDEKWPIGTDRTTQGRIMKEHNRRIFSEGYNARVSEENEQKETDVDHSKTLAVSRDYIASGLPLKALHYYKTTTGCSLAQAKAILNL